MIEAPGKKGSTQHQKAEQRTRRGRGEGISGWEPGKAGGKGSVAF